MFGARVRAFNFHKNKNHLKMRWFLFGGVGETRTLAPVTRPTPLAGVPRHQLEYYSNCYVFKNIKWRRGRDSNPWLLRVTGFQDQLLKPLGHLSIFKALEYFNITKPFCQPKKSFFNIFFIKTISP